MKNLRLIILLNFLLILTQAQASTSCAKTFRELMNDGNARILGDGEKVWGNYICKSCGEEESMKPTKEGDVRCESCGTPHTTEEDYPPAFFKKDGEIFLIDRKALVTVEDGKYQGHGLRDNCPFCETGHFANMTGCISCGATFENAQDVFKTLPEIGQDMRSTTSMHAVNSGQGNYVSARPPVEAPRTQRATNASEGLKEKIHQTISLSSNQKLAIGAAGSVFGLTAGTAGYYRATETYTVKAVITDIKSDTVYAHYMIEDQSYTIDLTYDQGKSTKWRIGETIEVYIVHWKGPLGIERTNGEVYPVNK